MENFYHRLKSVEIQGAINIAKESLRYLKNYAKSYGFGNDFNREAKRIEKIRPTAVVLHNVLEELLRNPSFEKIDELLRRLEEVDEKVSTISQRVIPNGACVLTHCHSTEVVSCLVEANELGKNVKVYATKTEPLHQGLITAKELAKASIDVTLINDNAVGYFMEEVDLVLVGTDAIRKEGIVNKVGTSMIAIVAKEYSVPFYSIGSYFKLDRRRNFIVEKRSWKEVIDKKIKGVKVENPAFDLTSWRYVSGVVLEDGIYKPRDVRRLLNEV